MIGETAYHGLLINIKKFPGAKVGGVSSKAELGRGISLGKKIRNPLEKNERRKKVSSWRNGS